MKIFVLFFFFFSFFTSSLGAQTTPPASWPECRLGRAPVAPGPAPKDAVVFPAPGGPAIMSEAGLRGAVRLVQCRLKAGEPVYRGSDGVLRDVASNQPFFPVGWDAAPPPVTAGPQGPTGPRGPEGPKGPEGPAGRDGRDGKDAVGFGTPGAGTVGPPPPTALFAVATLNCPEVKTPEQLKTPPNGMRREKTLQIMSTCGGLTVAMTDKQEDEDTMRNKLEVVKASQPTYSCGFLGLKTCKGTKPQKIVIVQGGDGGYYDPTMGVVVGGYRATATPPPGGYVQSFPPPPPPRVRQATVATPAPRRGPPPAPIISYGAP